MNIQPFLDKHSDALVEDLRNIIEQDLPDDVRCIQALIFRESLPGIPFYVYFLNRFQGSSTGIKPIEPLAGLDVLIDSDDYIGREEAVVECFEIEDQQEQDRVYQEINDRCNSENLLVAKWFTDCWIKAGGSELDTPAFIMDEDGLINPINLKTGVQVKHLTEFSNVFDG
ncbi:hypothetical protein [Paraferrimonas sp. SM1919]|uniref:hypothetical protein n=1 Tax=Paraferrimonas sp. SM1919 TaxID=2662263 RepID=UPI0013D88BA8|nr:hypothetical protein [Paraferrimonas sp. SM1919]